MSTYFHFYDAAGKEVKTTQHQCELNKRDLPCSLALELGIPQEDQLALRLFGSTNRLDKTFIPRGGFMEIEAH
jgi:hypothetical protein